MYFSTMVYDYVKKILRNNNKQINEVLDKLMVHVTREINRSIEKRFVSHKLIRTRLHNAAKIIPLKLYIWINVTSCFIMIHLEYACNACLLKETLNLCYFQQNLQIHYHILQVCFLIRVSNVLDIDAEFGHSCALYTVMKVFLVTILYIIWVFNVSQWNI